MSGIKEQDILRLLRGEASPKKLKKLEAWASEDVENASDLELYQTIFDEAEHLNSYRKVDADMEWKAFSKALHNSVSDNELLNYFDGLASPSDRKKVEEWRDLSKSNSEEFTSFNTLISESTRLNEYKSVDVEAEWSAFSDMIKGKSTPANLTAVSAAAGAAVIAPKPSTPVLKTVTPTSTTTSSKSTYTPPPTNTSQPTMAKEVKMEATTPVFQQEKKTRSLWRPIAIAASLLLLVGFMGINLYQGKGLFGIGGGDELYATFATADTPGTLNTVDGSILDLDSESAVKYFTDINKINIRNVELDGRGVFDIASNPEKPFVLTSKNTGIGVRVLGTKFRIEGGQNEFLEIIENIEGSVRAYSLEDTTTSVILTKGDRYGWDGYQFINLNDIQEDFSGQDYDILYVLDYLMEQSDWKVISGADIEFDPTGVVNVDLSKSYEEILEDLAERADFHYVDRDCDGCYEVRKFVTPSDEY